MNSLSGGLLDDGLRVFQDQQEKIQQLTVEIMKQKQEAEAAPREHRATVETMRVELQLKAGEVKGMRTQVAERDTVVAKVRAELAERENTLAEARAETKNCHRLLDTAKAELASCQKRLDSAESQAKALRCKDEERRVRDTNSLRQELKQLESDVLNVRKDNTALYGTYLALHASNTTLREEKRRLSDRVSMLESEIAWLKFGVVGEGADQRSTAQQSTSGTKGPTF